MPTFNMAAQTPNGQPGGQEQVYTNGIPPQTYQARECHLSLIFSYFNTYHGRSENVCRITCSQNPHYLKFRLLGQLKDLTFKGHTRNTFSGVPLSRVLIRRKIKDWINWNVDALHLSIPAQGLPNGEAAIQHPAYPGMQPAYPGVGKLTPLSRHPNTAKWSYVCKRCIFILYVINVAWYHLNV